jgi:hypothetical protein
MPKYEFDCLVSGVFDGEVEAETLEQAMEIVEDAVAEAGLIPNGQLCIRLKDETVHEQGRIH